MTDAPVRLKHGTICTTTGRLFWGYSKRLPGGQWMTPEKFAAAKAKQKDWEARQPKGSARRTRQQGPVAAAKRSAYEKQKLARDKVGTRAKRAAKMRKARATNMNVRLGSSCRSRISSFLRGRGLRKRKSTAQLLGCTWAELRAHLERQFTPGMSWENYGEWYVDHITPLASVGADEEAMLRLCHFSNLQPLWAMDNFKKSATIPKP